MDGGRQGPILFLRVRGSHTHIHCILPFICVFYFFFFNVCVYVLYVGFFFLVLCFLYRFRLIVFFFLSGFFLLFIRFIHVFFFVRYRFCFIILPVKRIDPKIKDNEAVLHVKIQKKESKTSKTLKKGRIVQFLLVNS